MFFVEASGREADLREPGVEVGVAERAFSSQIAPLPDATDAVRVVTGR